MRSIARSLGLSSAAMALTAVTALAAAGPAGAAPAGTESLYAPSALVLSLSAGEDPAYGTVLRAVTLSCMPGPSGTHPDPAGACAELRAEEGEFAAITEGGQEIACTREWDPMSVTAAGVWEGQLVTFEHTFANPCAFRNGSGVLFGF
ncbi:alkaline protease [Streptomyces venezuelae]|uniref:Probable subtilase-type protease inhibitor n=1 Tax=Streptomyces venezuelae TaxID=54571 RepID=A0A5P2DEF9_STRVZ|nr:subtilase-type protease inhibitor [Streptomyces venezuelae]QES51641.1 alkaline protease [Streptomyces venezuelae]